MIRPGIIMTVKFAGDNRAHEFLIMPEGSDIVSDSLPPKVMPTKVTEEIIDEIAPARQRGRYRDKVTAEWGCISLDEITYEYATIGVTNRCNQQGGGTLSVHIELKKVGATRTTSPVAMFLG